MEACCCSSSSSILTVRAIDVTRLSPLRCSSLSLFQPAAFRSGFLHLSSNHFFIRRASPCSSFRQRWKPSVFAVFERFTERAIRAVVLSQREARGLGKELVSPQHLLLGLIAEDRSIDGFLGSGITVGRARDAVRGIWSDEPTADEGHPSGSGTTNIPFSISSKRVFEAAVEFSRSTACNFIAPEHIAVGLFTTDDGSSGLVLKRLGADANKLTSAALLRLQGELAKDGRETSKVASKMWQKSPIDKAARVQSSDKSKDKSMMFQFCVDVTSLANEGRIDPVIGRDIEIQRVVQILCRRTKNNPILLGDPGVGKTAIAEGLALQISCGNIPLFLVGKRIMSLDVGLLMAGSKERGELEARVKGLIAEVQKAGDVILFIDEVHTLVWSGTAGKGNKGSGLDISNLLKPTLGRGELQCIASTTLDEYRAHFERDKALARRFQPVFINEPSQEDAVRILMGLREKYESHHKCRYTLEAINAAVYFSARYIPDRHLPDKAIDLIDEAGSKARMNVFRRMKEEQTSILSKSPEEYWQEIEAVQSMHQMVLENKQNFMSTRSNSDINELTRSIIDARESIAPSSVSDEVPAIVGAEEIASVASLWSGIPLKQLSADEMKLLFGLDEELRKRVLGQDDAINAISRAVKRSRLGLKDPDRPIAAMLFCGPTGVGKTELTKALAASYFGSESEMVRLDMSEYMERHSVSKLIGSPPGYLGYGEGGALTEAVRRRPFTVILLDEIEKAHPDIFNILLQVFEDGRLTDSQGRRVSFKNTLIIMTSNAGSASISRGGRCAPGFMLADSNSSYSALKSLVMEELREYFRPELLNRIDEVVVFRPLEKDQMREILNVMLKEVKRRMSSLGMALEVSESVKELVCQQGFERSYGARPLRRALTRLVEDVVSEAILAGDYKPGDTIFMDLSASGAPVLSRLADTATTPTPI